MTATTFTTQQQAELDSLFKKLGGKAFGSTAFLRPSEALKSGLTLDAARVYVHIPPLVPPTNSTPTIKKWWPAAEGGDGWIVLSRDRSVADGSKWVALPVWNANYSSGGATDDVNNSIIKGMIGTYYGNGYLEMVYDGTDAWIPGLSDALPTLDGDAGVLTFAIGRSETGNTQQDSIKIKVYQNTGQTLADVLATMQAPDTSTVDLVAIYTAARDAP